MTRGRRAAVVAMGLILAVSVVAGTASARVPGGTPVPLGQYEVSVSVTPTSFGPMQVRVVGVKATGNTIFAKLAIENTSRFTATMKDRFPTSVFARGGNKQLLAGDEGCGWGYEHAGDPVQPGFCDLVLRIYTTDPGDVAKLKVFATRGLPGMNSLSAGHYEFDRELRFRFEREKLPTAIGHLVVSYDVTRSIP